MAALIKKLLDNDKIRYLIAGGLTTLVNLVSFYLLRTFTSIDRNICNTIAIILAIVFAYIVNKLFVFKSHCESVGALAVEIFAFFAARLFSMVVEVLGFALLCDSFRMSEFWAKIVVQFIVVVLNYVLSKVMVFTDKKIEFKEWVKENWSWLLASAITFVFMIVVYIVGKVTPFGTNCVNIIDSMHQYLPFFSDYQDKLVNEGSLFYTFDIGMGVNFQSLLLYYMASPLNLLLILFDRAHVNTVMAIVVALKITFSAGAFGYGLSRRKGKITNNAFIVAFSLAYALNNYMVGYYWNLMWLDCIMVFPLIILGFEKLMEEKDYKLYTVALFYSLYCNYYISFIICLFLVLWFFTYNHKDVKKYFFDGLRFAAGSLMAGGMAAFSLFVAYFGIMTTASAKAGISPWEWYGNIADILKQHLFLTKPLTNQNFDGGANLYCGVLTILLFVLYFYSERIKLYDKISRLILLAFLVVSFNQATLNYIWHGFHNQYGIPNRFAFVYIFVLLYMGYEAIVRVKTINVAYIISAILIAAAFVFYLMYQSDLTSFVPEKWMVIMSVALIVIYGALLILRKQDVIPSKISRIVIAAFFGVEILVNAGIGFSDHGFADGKYYLSDTKVMQETVALTKEYAEANGDTFYREEMNRPKMLDESTYNNMKSIGTFCSTVNGDVVTIMGRMGFYSAANEYLYTGATPLTNSIFNTKYVYVRDDEYYPDAAISEPIIANDKVTVYENKYVLPIAFAVNKNIAFWNPQAGDPAKSQNDFVALTAGTDSPFTQVFEDMFVSGTNCTANTQGFQSPIIEYYADEDASTISIQSSFDIEEPGLYLMYVSGNYMEKIGVTKNGEKMTEERYQMAFCNLGNVEAGDTFDIDVKFSSSFSKSGTIKIRLFKFSMEALREYYEKISPYGLSITEYADGYIAGNIKVDSDMTLFTSIPYDKGWKFYVDGELVETIQIADAFMGIDLSAGEHTVEMKYTPYGMYPGLLVTAFSWICFILVVSRNRKSEKTAEIRSDVSFEDATKANNKETSEEASDNENSEIKKEDKNEQNSD